MHKLAISTACLLSLLLLGGCKAKPEDQVVGTWQYKDLVVTSTKATLAQISSAKTQLAAMSLVIGADKTFKLSAPQGAIVGKWTMTGSDMTMQPATIQGKSVDEIKSKAAEMAATNPRLAAALRAATNNIKAALSADGKTVTMQDSTGGGSVLFSKSGG